MKTIGLVGGTGWVSSIEYYRIINEEINKRLGALEAAKCILFSLNYGEIDSLSNNKNSEGVFSLVNDAAVKLVKAGADFILICANTLHQFADRIEANINVPLIHIAEATGNEIQKKGFHKVGLLGTRQTMVMPFYKTKLKEKNIEVIIPDNDERELIQNTISNELLKNIFLEESRNSFVTIINKLKERGAEGIILGCTEIPLLINQNNSSVPLFDTLRIHALAAVDFVVNDK